GPYLSHNLPISNLANTVPETAKIMEFHFWAGVKPKSLTTSGINGTIPNHAKKHIKNDIDVIQNVRVGIDLKLNKFNFVALSDCSVFITSIFIRTKISINT